MNEPMEQIFMPGMRDGLCRLFGVSTIQEVIRSAEVTLPEEIFSRTASAIEASGQDYRERDIRFGFKRGMINVVSEWLGTEIDANTQRATSVPRHYLAKVIWNSYFGEPLLLAFHTHPPLNPSLGEQYKEIQFLYQGKTLFFNDHKKILELLAARLEYASGQDIEHLTENARYIRSMLVGGEWGYKFLVNPNLNLPAFATSKKIKLYEEKLDYALINAAVRARRGEDWFDQFHAASMDALETCCKQNNLLLFINDNPSDPTLGRYS